VTWGGVAQRNLILSKDVKMLNAYGSNFKFFIYKSQLLFSLAFWFLYEGFLDRSWIRRALSFCIYDELAILDRGFNDVESR
jgi:hypothetical protein